MKKEYRNILKNKNFLYLWLSQILSQLTINILNFILLIKIYTETESSIASSFLWVSYAIPAIIIGPIAAASVDMINKRKMLIITNLLQSVTIFFFAFVSEQSLFLIYGIVIVYSFLNKFYIPAEQSSLPSVVEKQFLPLANSLFFITQQMSLVIGYGVAGILFQTFGVKNSLIINSIFLFLAFLSVIYLPNFKSKIRLSENFEELFIAFFRHIYEGYKLIKSEKYILMPFLLLMGLQVALSIAAVNIPSIATEILRVKPALSGIFIVIPAGVGTAMASILIPKFMRKGYRKVKILKYSLSLIIILLLLLIFLIPILPIIFSKILGIIFILLLGLGFIGIFIPCLTFLQEKTPEEYRGRVFGNYGFLVSIITVIPLLASGTLTELLGARFLLLIFSVFLFFILIFIYKKGEYFFAKN